MLPERPRAVVTGASSGLGRAFALQLAKRGGSLLLGDVDEIGLEETRRLVESAGATAITMRCDVSRVEHIEALAERAYGTLGEVDLLVNNAGLAVAGPVGEALIMTAAGLAVAIPAVLAYNLFGKWVNACEVALEGFAHDLRELALEHPGQGD